MCTGFDLFCYFTNFLETLERMFSYLLLTITTALVAVLDMLPLPFNAADVSQLFANIPATVWWFADIAQLSTGMGIAVSAMLVRFIIRRLPVVG